MKYNNFVISVGQGAILLLKGFFSANTYPTPKYCQGLFGGV